MIAILVIASVSYFIGSIPSGYLISRLAGVDIRQQGSGNIGATNVTRTLGKRYGYPVFLADFGKGLCAVLLAPVLAKRFGLTDSLGLSEIVAGVFAVVGNAFPVWLRFRGGKGVATSAGLFFGLIPAAALIATLVWIVAFYTSRYVSLASVLAAVSLPVAVFLVMHFSADSRRLLLPASIGLAIIVLLRHRSNLTRLMGGTEERFERGKD